MPPAEQLELKKWKILDNSDAISFPDDELFYGTDYLLITSTPESTFSPAPEKPDLPLNALEPSLSPVTSDSSLAPAPEYLNLTPITAPETTLSQATAPDPTIPPVTPGSTLAPAPEDLTLVPLAVPEPAHKPPIREPCGHKCRRKCSEDRRRESWC